MGAILLFGNIITSQTLVANQSNQLGNVVWAETKFQIAFPLTVGFIEVRWTAKIE